MFLGPMFRREWRAAGARNRWRSASRTVLAAVMGGIAWLIVSAYPGGPDPGRLLPAAAGVAGLGRALFLGMLGLEVVLLVALVADYLGGTVAEEREQDTLALLLMTRLTTAEILLTKLAAGWLHAWSWALVGLPLLVGAAALGDMEGELVAALAVLLASSAFMATLAILASTGRGRVGSARAQAFGWIVGWLVVPPLLTCLPIRAGSIWGDLLGELKSVAGVIAPSSPLALATDPGWYYRPRVVHLADRVAGMIGLQALLGVAVFGVATRRLRGREWRANWADPTRGFRPPCGDDPIFWREFVLPHRRGGGSAAVIALRSVVILAWTVAINLARLAGILLGLAIPAALVLAMISLGGLAFRESWDHGLDPAAPYQHRSHFNMLIRAVTAVLALNPLLMTTNLVADGIIRERNGKTWDAFLATPLTAREILRSKVRVAVHRFGVPARLLPIAWAAGIACGAITPLGVALAAADCAAAAWAAIVLGLILGVRPGRTSTANSLSLLVAVVYFNLHGTMLLGALISPREWAGFGWMPGRLRWALVLLAWALPIATAGFAWWGSRLIVARFDDWAGRPRRPRPSRRDAAPAALGDSEAYPA